MASRSVWRSLELECERDDNQRGIKSARCANRLYLGLYPDHIYKYNALLCTYICIFADIFSCENGPLCDAPFLSLSLSLAPRAQQGWWLMILLMVFYYRYNIFRREREKGVTHCILYNRYISGWIIAHLQRSLVSRLSIYMNCGPGATTTRGITHTI